MKYIVRLILDDTVIKLNLFEIDVSQDDRQNVNDAINCEMWYNDFDMNL